MNTVSEIITRRLAPLMPPLALKSVVSSVTPSVASARAGELDIWTLQALISSVEAGVKTFGSRAPSTFLPELRRELTGGRPPKPTQSKLRVSTDSEVLLAARESQRLTRALFAPTDVVRLATVVSELARNIYMYAKEGTIELTLSESPSGTFFEILAVDRGPGIPDVNHVLSGSYVSKTGLGRGLVGTRSMLDELTVVSTPATGTRVYGKKRARR